MAYFRRRRISATGTSATNPLRNIKSRLAARRQFCRMRFRIAARAMLAAVLAGGGILSSVAASDSLILQGNYIRTGVSSNGTLGVGGNTSPGFVFDASGTGTFNPANDYLTPGSPFEGFSVSYAGTSVLLNNNASPTTASIGSITSPSVATAGPDYDQAVVWNGTNAGAFTLEHVYALENESQRLDITTTITALADLTDVKFARWIDPDSGGMSSINTRGNTSLGIAEKDWVNSVSETNGATLGLYTDSLIPHNSAITMWTTDPATYTVGSGNANGDLTIGLGFDIGSLATGEAAVLKYAYAVAADSNDFASLSGGKWLGETDPHWDIDSNWDPHGAPTDGDAVRIDSSGNATVNHNVTGNTYTGISFQTTSAQVTFTGNDLTVASGGSVANSSSFQQTFDVALITAGNLTVSGGTEGMSFNDIQIASGSTLTYDSGASNSNVVLGVISGTGSALTKTGAGTLTLSGANTYGGGTTISDGTLVVNTATLPDDVTNHGTVHFDQSTDGTFGGDITGTGALMKSGGGVLVLSGENSYAGGTTITAGTLIGSVGSGGGVGTLPNSAAANPGGPVMDIQAGATLTVLQAVGQDGTIAGDVAGDGTFIKDGDGRLTIGGNVDASTGGIYVQQGTLSIAGTVDGMTIVDADGRLAGTGTYNSGIEVRSGGALAPGNSIGTINTNNYTQAMGSVLEIEIDENGNSDLISDSGTTTIDGGTVVVMPDAGADVSLFRVGDEYTFLTSANPILGAGFEGVGMSGFDFPLVTLVRGTHDYRLRLLGFEFISTTANQASFGAWLDNTAIAGSADMDLQNVMGSIGGLPTYAEMGEAMDQLTGEVYPSLAIANLQLMDNFYSRLSRRIRTDGAASSVGGISLRAQRTPGEWTGGIYGQGSGGVADSDANALGFTLSTGGTTILLERDLGRHTDVGFVFDYANTRVALDGSSDHSDFDNYRWASYLRHDLAAGWWTVAAHLGYDDYETNRRIAFGAGGNQIARTATADHRGWQAGTYVERGWNWNVLDGVLLQPLVALQYLHYDQADFAESGAGSISIASPGTNLDSLRTRLGAAVDLMDYTHGMLSFEAIWNHELLSRTTGLVDNRLPGAAGTSAFTVRGVDLGRDWVTLGPYANLRLTSNAGIYGGYSLNFNQHQTFHTGGGGLTITW